MPEANKSTESVATAFAQHFIPRFGVPEEIHSDWGREFHNHLFTHPAVLLGIDKTCSLPASPQGEGQIEHTITTLEQILRIMVTWKKVE